ncbi:MAG: hypothetical protein AAFU53_12995, partial [Cyanobacteria bacterium J06632_3]
MNILLVEDDYLIGRSMAGLLESSGPHKVRFTYKVADVFRCCRSDVNQPVASQPIELVIINKGLTVTFEPGKETDDIPFEPGVDIKGVDLSVMLKTHPQTQHLPIILLSAQSMDVEAANVLRRDAMADALWIQPMKDTEGFLTRLAQIESGDGFQ